MVKISKDTNLLLELAKYMFSHKFGTLYSDHFDRYTKSMLKSQVPVSDNVITPFMYILITEVSYSSSYVPFSTSIPDVHCLSKSQRISINLSYTFEHNLQVILYITIMQYAYITRCSKCIDSYLWLQYLCLQSELGQSDQMMIESSEIYRIDWSLLASRVCRVKIERSGIRGN